MAAVSEPDSTLVYDVIADSYGISGILGVSGTMSLSGQGGSGVPEPGTTVLLAVGLALIGIARCRSRARG